MKRRKGTSHILIRGPGGRQNYFKPKRHYLVLAASGASDQDVWVFMDATFHGGSNDIAAGKIADLSPSTFSYPWQLPTSMGSLSLSPANKFTVGVVVTSDNCSLVINLSPVSTTTAITENL
jgi:hypothetical protein